mgnify:CR=1 FL=1
MVYKRQGSWGAFKRAGSTRVVDPYPANGPLPGVVLSAFKGETTASNPTDGLDFPVEARRGLEPQGLEPTPPWEAVPSATAAAEMAPDIRQQHMPKQGETNAIFWRGFPLASVCKSPCAAKHQGGLAPKRREPTPCRNAVGALANDDDDVLSAPAGAVCRRPFVARSACPESEAPTSSAHAFNRPVPEEYDVSQGDTDDEEEEDSADDPYGAVGDLRGPIAEDTPVLRAAPLGRILDLMTIETNDDAVPDVSCTPRSLPGGTPIKVCVSAPAGTPYGPSRHGDGTGQRRRQRRRRRHRRWCRRRCITTS